MIEPDDMIDKMRALVTHIDAFDGQHVPPDLIDEAVQLADLFKGLDRWLRGGGFIPKQWMGQPHLDTTSRQTFVSTRTELSRLLRDHIEMTETLMRAQDRGTTLAEENRALRAQLAAAQMELHALRPQ